MSNLKFSLIVLLILLLGGGLMYLVDNRERLFGDPTAEAARHKAGPPAPRGYYCPDCVDVRDFRSQEELDAHRASDHEGR